MENKFLNKQTVDKDDYAKFLFNLQQKLKEFSNRTEPKKEEDYYAFNYNPNIEGEEWKNIEGEGYSKYSVSNYGRVKYCGFIVPQKNKIDDNGKEMKEYLVLDKEKFGEMYKDVATNFNLSKDVFVYSLVAYAFLGKKEGDYLHVHHITNDGYDNSVNNLILLTKEEHSLVHSFKIG